MSKKIKLAQVDMETFTQFKQFLPQTPPIEILAPKSYEQVSDMGAADNIGVLGNTIAGSQFFLGREYSFNWVGNKKEIDRIRFYLTNTSKHFFMFSGLNDNSILTPTVMFNSKAMLASLVDQYKPTDSDYSEMLVRYDMDQGGWFKRGSTGVVLTQGQLESRQFNTIPGNARGAAGFVYLEAGKDYGLMLDPNYMNDVDESLHVVPFMATILSLDPGNFGGITSQWLSSLKNLWVYNPIDAMEHDAILRLEIASPSMNVENYDNVQLRGIANYSAPIVAERQHILTVGRFQKALTESYADTPSLLTPVGTGAYSILSPSLAEFSISFKEVVNVIS